MSYNFRPLILRDPVANTPELQQEIEVFTKKWSENHRLPENRNLFHYTDLEGLRGILDSKQLWMSHMSSLNDPLEVEYGQKIIYDEINKRLIEEDNRDVRTFYDSIKQTISGFGKTLHHGFISCFCEDSNLLSQWREYSDRGGGYCIGFNFNSTTRGAFDKYEIENSLDQIKSGDQPLLRKLIYDEKIQRKLVNEYLDKITKGYSKGIVGRIKNHFRTSNHHTAVMGGQAIDMLLDMVLSFKHPAFKEEREWRILNIVLENNDPENFSFRRSGNDLISFRKMYVFNINDNECFLPISSITVGPILDQNIAKSSITLLLHHVEKKSELIKLKANIINVIGAGYSLRQ